MLPAVDIATAEAWASLAAEIGRKTCHGAAHDPDPAAWAVSGRADADAVVAAVGRPEGQLGTVVDWGAGAGRVAHFMAWWSDQVFMADAAGGLLADARGEAGPGNLVAVQTLDPAEAAPQGGCDLVYSLHVLYSVTPEGVRATIEQLGGLLKVGGKLVLDIPWWYAEPYHKDPDPVGLPGGWWIHTGQTMMNGIDHLWLRTVPPPLSYTNGAPRWSDLTELRLWVWEKQP
jgi:SAM-dependent methyltransferase